MADDSVEADRHFVPFVQFVCYRPSTGVTTSVEFFLNVYGLYL